MLSTFPKAFPIAVNSQGYFAVSQAATSQICSTAALGPLSCSSRSLTFPLGSCRLGNLTFEKLALVNLSFGKSPFGKSF